LSGKEESGALSEREEQVLLYATRGLTDKEIARKLGISTATVLTYWMRIRNKLGGSNRAELVASAVRKDAQGEITAKQTENQLLLGEILRRMQAEEAVRENEERYRTLFNGGSDWIVVYHLDENNRPGKFIEVNDIACERLGYTREELLEMSVYDLVDRTLVSPQAELDSLIEQKRIITESVHVTKDSMRLPTEVSATLFEMGGKPTVQAVCRDLTARKEAEHALKDAYEAMERRVKTRTSELEEMIQSGGASSGGNILEVLLNASADAVFGLDRDSRVTIWNPRMEQLSGVKKSKATGQKIEDVGPAFGESVKALKGKSIDAKALKVDGKALEATFSPLHDASGSVVGVLGVVRSTGVGAAEKTAELV
jgi:PAS domain S-box-containing protein